METKNSDTLFNWRREVVTNGVGVFNPSTAVSAKGAIITNADGEELIDFVGGIGVLNSGHCPEPVVKAIQEQAAKLIHTCFNVATYSVYMELADELISLFPRPITIMRVKMHGEHFLIFQLSSEGRNW